MLKVLLRLWPALIPLLIFVVWYLISLRKATDPKLYDVFLEKRKTYMLYTLLTCCFVIILTLLYYGMTEPATLIMEIENDQVNNHINNNVQ